MSVSAKTDMLRYDPKYEEKRVKIIQIILLVLCFVVLMTVFFISYKLGYENGKNESTKDACVCL